MVILPLKTKAHKQRDQIQVKSKKPPGQSAHIGLGSLPDIILLSLAVVFVIIGMYEIMTLGPSSGYWAVMIAMVCFFWYYIRKNNRKPPGRGRLGKPKQ